MPSVKRLLTYPKAVERWGEPAAMMVDYYRKENARIEIVEVTPPMSAGQMWDVLSRRSGPLQSSDHAGKLKLE